MRRIPFRDPFRVPPRQTHGDVALLEALGNDLLDADDLAKMRTLYPDAAFISAQKAMGLRGLLYTIAHIAGEDDKTLHVCIPFDQGFLIHMVHERCQIIRTCYQASGLQMTVRADKQMQATLSPFTCS